MRHFDEKGRLTWIGTYKNGRPFGVCWKIIRGGGAVGMDSNKMSIITIFGEQNLEKNLIRNFIFVHIWIQLANLKESYTKNDYLMNHEQNEVCDKKILLLKYSKIYIISFLL